MLKIGDKVRIRGVEGIHTVEANGSEHLPLRAGGETFTVYGQCYDDDGNVSVELVEEPFEFRVGDRVSVKGIEGMVFIVKPSLGANEADIEEYPFAVWGELFTKEGKPYMLDEVHLTLVERPVLNPTRVNERPAFIFELHDKVAFKGWESMEHFILQPNDIDDDEGYPFKAVTYNGKAPSFTITRDGSFTITRDGRLNISNSEPAIVLIDRPTKLSVTKVVDGVEVLDVGNYKLHYKSDLLCEKIKDLMKEQYGTNSIDDPKVTEAQLETFTRGVEHAEKLLKEHAELKSPLWDAIRERLANKAEPLMQISLENYERFRFSRPEFYIPDEDRKKLVDYAKVALYPSGGHVHGSSEELELKRDTPAHIPREEFIMPKRIEPFDFETFTKGTGLLKKGSLPVKCQVVEGGKLPTYAHDGDAGMDLYVRAYERADDEHIKYFLGIKLDLDEGYAAFIFPRSSVYKSEQILSNCVGVVDSGYKGEISAVFKKHTSTQFMVGDRACQMVIMPVPKVRLVEVEELRDSLRGSNGYGSSGK